MKREDNNQKNNTEKYTVIMLGSILFMLCVMTIIMIISMVCRCTNMISVQDQDYNGGGVGMLIDPNAVDSSDVQSSDEEQGVAISGISAITIPQGEKEVNVDFYNPDKNADMYYQTFELRLTDDSGGYETIYTSGLVEPGKHINHITLSRGLEAGVYQAVIHVQPYRMNEERTPTNNADIKTELIVK